MSSNAVAAAVVITGGGTALRVMLDSTVDRPPALFKVAAGSMLLGAALTLADMLSTDVGTGLAVLVTVMSLLFNAPAIATAITRGTNANTGATKPLGKAADPWAGKLGGPSGSFGGGDFSGATTPKVNKTAVPGDRASAGGGNGGGGSW